MRVIAVDRELPEVWTLSPAVHALHAGELVVLPTDTIYGLACDPWNRQAVGRLYTSKGMLKTKRCAVLCSDLKQVGSVARAISDDAFRFMRSHLPGPYTVLLNASSNVPRQATGKRKTIGVRMPSHDVPTTLVEEFGGPIMVTSLPHWDQEGDMDPVAIAETVLRLRPAVVIDQGPAAAEPSTVVDFTKKPPELVRMGKGPLDLMV